jgi:hypothetical protein
LSNAAHICFFSLSDAAFQFLTQSFSSFFIIAVLMLSFCLDAGIVSELTSPVVKSMSPVGDPVLEPKPGLMELEGMADLERNEKGAKVVVLGQES